MKITRSNLRRIIREELSIAINEISDSPQVDIIRIPQKPQIPTFKEADDGLVSKIRDKIAGVGDDSEDHEWLKAGKGLKRPDSDMIAQLRPIPTFSKVQTWTPEGETFTVHYIGRGNVDTMMRKWQSSSAPKKGVRPAEVDGKNYYYAVVEGETNESLAMTNPQRWAKEMFK